jgi:predicted class III extradiol MEMO1 family dioxygenase
VVFLQHLYGPNVKILPLLCGSFGPSIMNDGRPEDDDLVRRFFDKLGEIAERERERLFWVLGVDMSHVGIRYGEQFAALADQNEMVGVGERDMDRIASLLNGDADGFWQKIKVNRDDIKWCGSSPFYTFMKVVPGTRGALQSYEQWNIDPQSVVSFAGISFTKA